MLQISNLIRHILCLSLVVTNWKKVEFSQLTYNYRNLRDWNNKIKVIQFQ